MIGLAETVRFYLLDINDGIVDGKPEIRLWGTTPKGERILVRDQSFLPRFYLLIKDGVKPEKAIEDVRGQKLPKVVEAGVEEKRRYGKQEKVLRVVCGDPEVLAKYSEILGKLAVVKGCFGDDLRFSQQYLVYNDVSPCGTHEVKAEPIEAPKPATIEKAYLAANASRSLEQLAIPPLRVAAFSMIAYSEKGTPRPERSPIAIISIITSEGRGKQFVAEDLKDKDLIREFVGFIRKYDPDIIVGYGNNRHEWPYLMERLKKLGAKLSVDRTGGEPHTSLFGHVSVAGRANIDLFDFAEDMAEVKVKTLENFAGFLGIPNRLAEFAIRETEIAEYWREKRDRLVAYSKEASRTILESAKALLPFAMQLSNITGMPLDHVVAAAVGFRVDWYLVREAHRMGELIPKPTEQPYYPYKGAVVLEPKTGIHDDIAVLDFASMYPNLMILHNVSPDSLVRPGEKVAEEDFIVIPEVGHRFRKEPPGFFNKILSNLLKAREGVRNSLAKLDEKSVEYRILKEREKALKIIANACYGYTGWVGARWYVREVAESTTALGRYTIQKVIQMAKKLGLDVVYGDTDAIFVRNDEEKVEKLLSWVKKDLEMEIRPSKSYVRILFTEAKKRYAGLLPDGRLDIVGLEVVRGDWSEAAKTVQEKTLELILKEKSPKQAAAYVSSYISGLKAGKVPLGDLIIWKTLTKPVEEYAVRASHVEAAKKLLKAGWQLTLGDKVGYVIRKGQGKLFEKATPYTMASLGDIDVDYYIHNQILPVALRVLEPFGITEDDVLEQGGKLSKLA